MRFGEFPWLVEKGKNDEKMATDVENSISLPSSIPPTEEEIKIDQACVEWAGRYNKVVGRLNMSEFLQEFHERTGIYLTTDLFKKALLDAGKRGLIVKKNRRWRLPGNDT
jgi:hypothetical protein